MIAYSELSIWLLVCLLIVGLVLLCYGGDWLARGAASFAINWKINPIVVGLTVVAVATSMPELIAGFFAAGQGLDGLVVGNIVGSNLGNIGLILGVAALIYPIRIQSRMIRQEMPILLAVTLLFTFMGIGLAGGPGVISRIDSIILLAGTVCYVGFVVHQAIRLRHTAAEEAVDELAEPIRSQWVCGGLVFAGSLGLAAGADFLVGSSSQIATRLGVSDGLIGLTVVAIGTSLPELAASIAAALRRHSDIIVGNIVGSNIFNMQLIGGGVGVVYPIKVDAAFYRIEYPAMVLSTVILWVVLFTKRQIDRTEGAVFLLLYALILGLATLSQQGKL